MHLPMLTVPATAKCTVGPTATTGERCGQPAVTGFVSGSRHYYECAQHDGHTESETDDA